MKTKKQQLEAELSRMKSSISYLTEAGENFGSPDQGASFNIEPEGESSNKQFSGGNPASVAEDNTIEIDITDVVGKTEENSAKIDTVLNSMNDQFNQLVGMFGDLKGTLDSKVQSVKDTLSNEIKNTHPTPKHKLELRSLDAAPFSISPNNYFDNKLNNYEIVNANIQKDGKDLGSYNKGCNHTTSNDSKGDYTLTDVDVNNSYDETEVANSFLQWRPY